MRAVVRDHIKQLEVANGGGIISEKIRVGTIENRMLVIGIGGTGIDALLRLKRQINRNFKLPIDNETQKRREKPDNIEFLAFETNEKDKNKKYIDMGLDIDNELVMLSNAETGQIMQSRPILDDYYTSWLSPELNVSEGTTGANGNRQAGRLLMFSKITTVVESIRKKIKVLSEGTDKKLYVFILTGVCGGTGSGCFLDIAYIVRGIMKDRYGPAGVDRADILGYIFLPDVNLSNKNLTIQTQEYIKKNGYAALKELDYWMNIEDRQEQFTQKYGDVLDVDSSMPPFNLCHLISATSIKGKHLENAYDYCMNVAAENIVNFMADEGQKEAGQEFAIHDYISNISMNIAQMPHKYAANYKYNIMGAAAAVLPIEEITTYLAYRLFKKIEKMFSSTPEKDDIDNFARKIGIDRDSILENFEKNIPEPLPGYENSERFSFYNVIKTQAVDVDKELKDGFLSRSKTEYLKVVSQLPEEIMKRFREIARTYFLSSDFGPIYISRLLNSNEGFCLLKTIKAYIDALESDIENYKTTSHTNTRKEYAQTMMREARSAIINKEKKKNNYIEAKINEYIDEADKIKKECMVDFYRNLYNLLNDENSRVYDTFTEILNKLNEIFNENAGILINAAESKDNKGNKTYFWNVVSIPDIVKMIEATMNGKDTDTLLNDFLNELLKNTDKWVIKEDDDLDIIGSISDFMTEKFGDLITKSMEDFLVEKYGQNQNLDDIVRKEIAAELDEKAVPLFDLSNSKGDLNFPSFGIITIPMKAGKIERGIVNYQTQAIGKTSVRFNIKKSTMTNRIFWLNTMNGIPLFAYTPLKLYEECYERTILEKEGVGRHLVQTENENWVNLPSPIPEKSWVSYANKRIKANNLRIRQLFEKAFSYKCIVEKAANNTTSNRFECIITKPFDLNEWLAGYELGLNTGEKPNYSGLAKCINDLKALFGKLEQETTKSIFGSYNEEFAKDNFIRCPQLIGLMEAEVKKYDEISKKITEFEELLKEWENEKKLYDSFVEALYTDTIKKKNLLYVYDKDLAEDEMEPFVDMSSDKKYPEYVMFKKFAALREKQRNIITKKTAIRKKNLISSEDNTVFINRLKELYDLFAIRKETLDIEWKEIPDGDKVYNFYKTVMLMVRDIISNF